LIESTDELSNDLTGVITLQRRLSGLERDLAAIEAKVSLEAVKIFAVPLLFQFFLHPFMTMGQHHSICLSSPASRQNQDNDRSSSASQLVVPSTHHSTIGDLHLLSLCHVHEQFT